MDPVLRNRIDRLIETWTDWPADRERYLSVHVPRLARAANLDWLADDEFDAAYALLEMLTVRGWRRLPRLITERLSELDAIESSRKSRLEAAAAERLRRELEAQEAARRAERRLARQRDDAARREEASRMAKAQLASRRSAIEERLTKLFEGDFLAADAAYASDPDSDALEATEYERLKAAFVRGWSELQLPTVLDDEQARAVAATTGDVLVVARAGSGKTRTLVARAAFLQRHCGVDPSQMLLLAFNRKAAGEVRSALSKAVGHESSHVMTFHALAYALVHPEEELLYDDQEADQPLQSSEIQEVIDRHIRDPEYRDRIRTVMLAHFREDWERIVEGGIELPMAEFLAHRRALPRETLRGEYVKSFGERVIANALFEWSVPYRYERNHRWNGTNYRPDFSIDTGPGRGIVIEYFGREGQPDYDVQSEAKRAYWRGRAGWTFIERSPRDLERLGIERFVASLIEELRAHGLAPSRRSEEEIWQLVQQRAIYRFTGAMRTFVGRARKRNLSSHDLASWVTSHASTSVAEAGFLEVGVSVYGGYLRRLAERGLDDFDGLNLWRAREQVLDGQTRFVRAQGSEQGDLRRVRYVLIDEFQDFSEGFYRLCEAIRAASPEVQYFCVGDDWQAINGFAGSELRFFSEFNAYFQETSRRVIRCNYRSTPAIVGAGNVLMSGRGQPAAATRDPAGLVLIGDLARFTPTTIEQSRHRGDEITPAVLRVIRTLLERDLDVVVLARRNGIPWFVERGSSRETGPPSLVGFIDHVRSFLPEEDRDRVTVSTTHKYKGLERAAVIVVDALQGSYPLIHPNWIFLRLFGDDLDALEEAERRLFYVALTRAVDALVILADEPRRSHFLADIEREPGTARALRWEEYPPVASLDGVRVEVRAYDAYDIKDHLKAHKFRFHAEDKSWRRSFPADGFSLDRVKDADWMDSRTRLEVVSEEGELIERR